MSYISFLTPYPPSANHYKNHRVVKGKVITYVDDEAKRFRVDVAWRAKAAGVRKANGRVALEIKVYPSLPKDWKARARKDPDFWDDTVKCIDVGNAEKCISDALNGVAWEDDKQVWDLRVMRMRPDEMGPRCMVTIYPIVVDKPMWEFYDESNY
jgi:crossover junction endodeoxyribonuclease RusA